MVHQLKTWDMFMLDIAKGVKTFEIRKNDRGFEVGHILLLQGYDQTTQKYTGKVIEAEITYLLAGTSWGIKEDYVVMSIQTRNYNF